MNRIARAIRHLLGRDDVIDLRAVIDGHTRIAA